MRWSEHPAMKLKINGALIGMLASCAYLVGCDSGLSGQIEKCVQAAMAANYPFKNSQDKAETELNARAYCLRAAAGKE